MKKAMFNKERERICRLNRKVRRKNIVILLLAAVSVFLFCMVNKSDAENISAVISNEGWDELCCTVQPISSQINI